jgi:hypothetical protein
MSKRQVNISENEGKVVAIVQDSAPITYKEIHTKYREVEKKDVSFSYIANIINHMTDEGIFVTTHGEKNMKTVQLADGVSVTEGKTFIPAPLTLSPEDRLKQVLNLYNVKGDIQQKIISILALNPSLDSAQALFGVLTNQRVEPSTARLIVETYYGAQQYAAAVAAGANRFGVGFGPAGFGIPYGYQQQLQPQPMYYQQTPAGLVPVFIASAGQPPPPQPPQRENPIVINTGQTRTVKRPMLDKDGKLKKDPATGDILEETVEEPVVLATGGGSSDATTLLLKYLLEGGGSGGGKVKDLEKEVNALKEKAMSDKIDQLDKRVQENIDGVIASVNKNNKDLVKELADRLDRMDTDRKHQADLEAIRGTAGERPIVSITKEVRKGIQEAAAEIRLGVQGLYGRGQLGTTSQMTPQQMEDEARRIRAQVTGSQ